MRLWQNPTRHLQLTPTFQLLQLLLLGIVALDVSVVHGVLTPHETPWFLATIVLVAVAIALLPRGPATTPMTAGVLLLTHGLLIAAILVLLSPVFGPYFQLLILVILSGSYWFLAKGALVTLLYSYLVAIVGVTYQSAIGATWELWQAGLYLFGLGLLAVLFASIFTRHAHEIGQHSQLANDFYFERTRLKSLINSMQDAVIATDEEGTISLYNAKALDLFDTNRNLQGKTIRDFITIKDEDDSPVDITSQALTSYTTQQRDDLHFLAHDGSRIDVFVSISPIFSIESSHHTSGYMVVLRDITKQKTLDEQRDEFISVASHELRTPIAIAEGNLSTALLPKFSDQLSEEGRALLEQAHENVVFLSTLVNDLHILSQAEQGRLHLQAESLQPSQFLEEFASGYRREAEEKGLTFDVICDGDFPDITVSVDAVKEVLQNFLTNAIKYTDEGKVELKAWYEELNDEVIFAVSDTGIGISEADKKRIFEKFYRSEDYRTRQSSGTGLGLYIIKRLAERMGGRIWFESRLNHGSTFYFAIPTHPPQHDDESELS